MVVNYVRVDTGEETTVTAENAKVAFSLAIAALCKPEENPSFVEAMITLAFPKICTISEFYSVATQD